MKRKGQKSIGAVLTFFLAFAPNKAKVWFPPLLFSFQHTTKNRPLFFYSSSFLFHLILLLLLLLLLEAMNVDACIESIKECKYLPENDMRQLCNKVMEVA